MTLKEMPKVGDMIRYIGKRGAINYDVTYGEIYVIAKEYADKVSFIDNTGEEYTYLRVENLDKFELVSESDEETPVEASPTVIELLANISRRLYEAEQTIKEQAYEINELYKAVAERG